MTLRDVSDFGGENGGKLALVGSGRNKTGVNGNEAAGQRKRVDGRISDREKEEGIT